MEARSSCINGRGCKNDAWVRRNLVETGLLAGIKQELLSPAAIEEVRRRVVKLAKAEKPAVDPGPAIEKAETEVANLTDAIASGALRSSPALAKRLQAAERELDRLTSAETRPPKGSAEHLMPRLVDEYRELVATLEETLSDEKNVTLGPRRDAQAIRPLPGGDRRRGNQVLGAGGSGGSCPVAGSNRTANNFGSGGALPELYAKRIRLL